MIKTSIYFFCRQKWQRIKTANPWANDRVRIVLSSKAKIDYLEKAYLNNLVIILREKISYLAQNTLAKMKMASLNMCIWENLIEGVYSSLFKIYKYHCWTFWKSLILEKVYEHSVLLLSSKSRIWARFFSCWHMSMYVIVSLFGKNANAHRSM